MIVVDTNVVSELIRLEPDDRVLQWLSAESPTTLHVSSVTLAELFAGVAALPEGRKKAALHTAVRETVSAMFDDRVLPFDAEAAEAYAGLMTAARRAGRSISFADGQIAATAASRGFAVATRDTDPYVAAGVEVVNPWD